MGWPLVVITRQLVPGNVVPLLLIPLPIDVVVIILHRFLV
jgi:hypothetical protein